MNVKKAKRQAEFWSRQHPSNTVGSYECAKAMHDAIMALPDDPPQEHEDLVEMARELVDSNFYHPCGEAVHLARAVIERFGTREPRKVEGWMAMRDAKQIVGFATKEEAQHYVRTYVGSDGWIARFTGTEEV